MIIVREFDKLIVRHSDFDSGEPDVDELRSAFHVTDTPQM